MALIPLSQVSIIAVGVEKYQHLQPIRGAIRDVDNIQELLLRPSSTGLYETGQFIRLDNPNSNTLRTTLNNYVLNCSAQNDVLIFYFSGHGVPIGHSDFGFCTTDARIHSATGSILPLTVLRLSDFIDTIRVMNITPILIIDACFSGIAGNALVLLSGETITNMKLRITQQLATNYALLCSCTDRQMTIGNSQGGIFSQSIFETLRTGIFSKSSEKSIICLNDIFQDLSIRIDSLFAESTPQLFLGETLPNIPLVKNSGFTPQRYWFSRYMGQIVASIWNEGTEREFTKEEILTIIGRGAYGNHRKLSYLGWGLLEDNPITNTRRLTERGRQFARGEIDIPDEVIYDPSVRDFVASPDATLISLNSLIS